MVARSFYLKCFLLVELQSGRDGSEFTSVNTLLCDVQNGKLDCLDAQSYGYVFTKPSFACRISSDCINKQELLLFPFSLLQKKGIQREKVEEDWSTMGVGWDADKVD